MAFRCVVPLALRPAVGSRGNHAEMANTLYTGGDVNKFGLDPDDGLVVVNRWTTPIVVAWVRSGSGLTGVMSGTTAYTAPHDDWWEDFDPDIGDQPVATAGAFEAMEVLTPKWKRDPMADSDGHLEWPLRIDYPGTVDASGFIVLHVAITESGYDGSLAGTQKSYERGMYAKVSDVQITYGTADQPFSLDVPTDIPERGLRVQLLHQSSGSEDTFSTFFSTIVFLSEPSTGLAGVSAQEGASYARGQKPGFNHRYEWRLRVDHDHPSQAVQTLAPVTEAGFNSFDWMHTTFLVKPAAATGHLRQKQRDDIHGRVRGVGNNPTSKQRSNRASVRNTYV